MNVGVTASSTVITSMQEHMLRFWLQGIYNRRGEASWFHHGDCIEGDAKAHDIAVDIGFKVHTHPPTNDSKRAFKMSNRQSKPKEYLVRNREIVDDVQLMFVLPDSMQEKLRSGTWSTYRYTKACKKAYVVIFPDGSVEFGGDAKRLLDIQAGYE